MKLCALILAGGTGTRFWPWSDDLMPKQFLPIADPRETLLQQARSRVAPLVEDRILVLTNEEYVPVVRTQLPDIPKENIVGEPMLRDTAAAVGLGAALAERLWPGTVQTVFPADHAIGRPERFVEILRHAARFAHDTGKLYTIGIEPAYPTEAYGYLERGERLESPKDIGHFRLDAFVEKPDLATAQRYVRGGRHDWNAGIFAWKTEAILEALARHLPQHATWLPKAVEAFGSSYFRERLRESFLQLPKISIDFGVMQSEAAAGNVHMVAGDFPWSDLGGWDAFADTLEPDAHHNRVYGHARDWNGEDWDERWSPLQPAQEDKDESISMGEVFTMHASGNLAFNSRRGHRVALVGVDDLAVIHTHTATLVTKRGEGGRLKELVGALPPFGKKGGLVSGEKVLKPWGWELWWAWEDDYAGKTLFLEAGKRFSLQYHSVKDETIHLFQGKVKLTTAARGETLEDRVLHEGDSIHVEPGRKHRIEALEDSLLLEVSTPFLWDVVRLSDDFGREGTRKAEVGVEKKEE